MIVYKLCPSLRYIQYIVMETSRSCVVNLPCHCESDDECSDVYKPVRQLHRGTFDS